jgi:hypothetical protein
MRPINSTDIAIVYLQALQPAVASSYVESQNAAAQMEEIIASRTGSGRALPSLTRSPAMLVSLLPLGHLMLLVLLCCCYCCVHNAWISSNGNPAGAVLVDLLACTDEAVFAHFISQQS